MVLLYARQELTAVDLKQSKIDDCSNTMALEIHTEHILYTTLIKVIYDKKGQTLREAHSTQELLVLERIINLRRYFFYKNKIHINIIIQNTLGQGEVSEKDEVLCLSNER